MTATSPSTNNTTSPPAPLLSSSSGIDAASATKNEDEQQHPAEQAQTSKEEQQQTDEIMRMSLNNSNATATTTEMTMEEVVEHIGFGKFHWQLLFLCGVGYFAEITELVVVSFVAPSIQQQLHLSNVQYGLLGSSSFVGMAVGAFFWGYVSDHCGRQFSFAVTVWLTFVGGFCSALAPNYAVLLFLRFTAAFGIGGMLPVDYTVFLEFLPQRHRGSYIVLVDAIGVVPALTLSATIAWYFAGNNASEQHHVQWRGVLLLSSIPVGIMAVLRRHVPESPRYHLAAGETAAAQQVVQTVADTNSVRLPEHWRLLSLQETMELESNRTENNNDDDESSFVSSSSSTNNRNKKKNTAMLTIQSTAAATTQQQQQHGEYAPLPNSLSPETEFTALPSPPQQPPQGGGGAIISYHNDENGNAILMREDDDNDNCHTTNAGHSFDELLRDPSLRSTTIRLWIIYFLVQLSSAGMVFALPKLFDETFTGKSERDIALDLLIGVVGLIPGLAIAFVAVERSRTKTLAAFLLGAGLSVLGLGWAFLNSQSQAWALFFSIALRGAMEGCFAVLNTTAVESYPTLLRASGLGTAQIFDHIAGSFSPVVFSALNATKATKPWVFGIYAVAYLAATIPALGLKEHATVDY